MTHMPDLTDEDFLDSASWDADNAWLVHALCMLRVAHTMITQNTQGLHWVATCVLFDRDAFRTVAANGFRTTPPMLYVGGHRVYLLHEDDYYQCESVAEAFFLWCCLIRTVYKDALLTGGATQYDLRKDLESVFNICCPRTAMAVISDDEGDEDDADLSDGARDLLEAFGLGDLHDLEDLEDLGDAARADTPPRPRRRTAREEELDSLFDGEEDEDDDDD
jgi:hypothetical protein